MEEFDPSDRMTQLVWFLAFLVVLFLISAAFEQERFFRPVLLAIVIVLLAILILSRYGQTGGGDLGGTL